MESHGFLIQWKLTLLCDNGGDFCECVYSVHRLTEMIKLNLNSPGPPDVPWARRVNNSLTFLSTSSWSSCRSSLGTPLPLACSFLWSFSWLGRFLYIEGPHSLIELTRRVVVPGYINLCSFNIKQAGKGTSAVCKNPIHLKIAWSVSSGSFQTPLKLRWAT